MRLSIFPCTDTLIDFILIPGNVVCQSESQKDNNDQIDDESDHVDDEKNANGTQD